MKMNGSQEMSKFKELFAQESHPKELFSDKPKKVCYLNFYLHIVIWFDH